MNNLYTKIDLSELLSVSVGTIDNQMKGGKLPYVKFGKAVRFREEDVDDFVRKSYPKKYLSKKLQDVNVEGIKNIL